MTPTTTSSRRLMSSTPRSSWPSNGSSKTSTPMTSPSVTLKNKACRPVCLSSSTSHDRHEQGHEIQRQNSESEQIRILLARQREQILADCQAEIRKHEFQADYDGRRIRNEWNDRVAERTSSCSSRRLGSSSSSWEKSQRHGRIEAISGLYIRHTCKKKIGRRSRYYPWIHWQDTGIAKWSKLYERFTRFSGCWISSQWKFPRYQSTCVIPTSSRSWWNVWPLFRNADWIHGVVICRNKFTRHRRGRVRIKHQFRIRDASPDCQPKIHSSRRSLVARWDSRPWYVLVHKFLRKLCCGLEKWRWLIQWMIQKCSCSVRGLLSQIEDDGERSIEQEIRNKNFGAKNWTYERNAVVKNQGTKQRGQEILGHCWQWETNGQCSRGDNCSWRIRLRVLSCSRMSENHREPEVPEESPSGRMSRWPCKGYFGGTCNDSFCERWHPPEC